MSEPRFDVLWKEGGPSLDYHFCRGWEADANGEQLGCYGTNPNHGYTFDQAKMEIADWHQREANRWREMTLVGWGHIEDEPPQR